ncbi:MAG: hypothetical protein GY924_24540, partial [Planctomycetaceae bacterium]|nr:hypothetical protein [Planctomycetaceae bacterium]
TIWLLAVYNFRMVPATMDEETWLETEISLEATLVMLRSEASTLPLIAQYESVRLIGFGDSETCQFAREEGRRGAARLRSIQFDEDSSVSKLFGNAWKPYVTQLDVMGSTLLRKKMDPYSIQRVLLSYSKLLKYLWQLCYW